ncbi:MAG: glycosyltransferase, partial [Leadbetterella sp.]|nr:glycosyltransferase [Leadbetterella sp.]
VLPTYEENWAIVIGESMAAGTPVIAYDLKELTEVWKDSYVSVPTGDKVQFSKQIIRLLSSENELDDLSKRGKEYVKQYDWKSIANHELSIIMNLK